MFCLLLANVVLFVLDHVAHLSWVQGLYLYNARARWWQFITAAFCHGSFEHLSGNLFMLYVFGRIVEEEEGVAGVWGTYLICALGALCIMTQAVLLAFFAVLRSCKMSCRQELASGSCIHKCPE